MIHTVEGFSVVNKTEIDVFLEFSCFFNDPQADFLNICKKLLKKQNINTFGIYSKVTNNGNKNHKRECIQNLNVKDRMDFTMS